MFIFITKNVDSMKISILHKIIMWMFSFISILHKIIMWMFSFISILHKIIVWMFSFMFFTLVSLILFNFGWGLQIMALWGHYLHSTPFKSNSVHKLQYENPVLLVSRRFEVHCHSHAVMFGEKNIICFQNFQKLFSCSWHKLLYVERKRFGKSSKRNATLFH